MGSRHLYTEHRRSSRKSLRQQVGLDARIGSLTAIARDLSLGGMFVETGAVILPPNASVTVSFNLAHEGDREAFQLDAAVVRRVPEGLGLMFLQMEPDVIRTLSDALARHH